ncbi:GNAT family N-acetyltransferase [Nodosilinea nodulosa]|uniref:GNAT family N-acetyltransferase n=1 Tax=Nodosilinea nodulosa TaxID=416001 RepID=UPI00031290BF|nr:GNAT family N-acetyltransferase [Nodosilinea nodulosa]
MAIKHRSTFGPYLVRNWQPRDRAAAFALIAQVLAEYDLTCEPTASDRDVLEIEACYWETGGEFWVVETSGELVGTAGYYPNGRGKGAVELRKMYLHPKARGQGLGRYLLNTMELAIQQRGFSEIWIETASVLKTAVSLYESSGYEAASGVETARCDRIYCKRLAPVGTLPKP